MNCDHSQHIVEEKIREPAKIVQNCGMNLHKLWYLVSKLIKSVFSWSLEFGSLQFDKVLFVELCFKDLLEKVSLISVLWPKFGILAPKATQQTCQKHSKAFTNARNSSDREKNTHKLKWNFKLQLKIATEVNIISH